MSQLEITYRPTVDLKPYAENARTHSEAQIAQLAASITQFGWTNPVLVDEQGGLIAGHGRVRAALVLGIDRVPCVSLAGLTPSQKRALVIADNQLALNSGWNQQMLVEQLSDLGEGGFDVNLIGFDSAAIDLLFAAVSTDVAKNEWAGMPDFRQDDKTAYRSLIVNFKDQEALDAFAMLIEQKITDKTRYCWYPQLEIEIVEKRYESVPLQ